MSKWTQSNCVVTSMGNLALTEIAAKGGTMIFDSVWSCSERVADTTLLYELTDLPNKKQKLTLTRYVQVSSGYTIHTQITNEGLTEEYSIEMLGVYAILNGFNNSQPFLYMVLLVDEGTADYMSILSRSTYKYALYLYHTNKGNMTINLNSQDYVATETFENAVEEVTKLSYSGVYVTDAENVEIDEETGTLQLYTENSDTYPFVLPLNNEKTQHPLVIIRNYSGFLSNDGGEANTGVYIDDVGPFNLVPYDMQSYTGHYFSYEDLICVAIDNSNLKVLNSFNDTDYLPKDQSIYNSFNTLPFSEGFYSLSGSASNSPIDISNEYVWSVMITKSGSYYIVVALNNYDNNIYRRSILTTATSWSSATTWVSIGGGGGGVSTAKATFVTSANVADASQYFMRIMRDSTTNALKAGDVLAVNLTSASLRTDNTYVEIRYIDNTTSSNTIKTFIRSSTGAIVPCCQLPLYFLVQYDGEYFRLLTPLAITTTVSTNSPTATDGKYGDIWYTY